MDIKAPGSSGQMAVTSVNIGASRTAPMPAAQSKPAIAPISLGAAVTQPAPKATVEQVNEALENINKTMQSLSADLEFSVDAETGRSIIKVTDKQTGEIIRQMPSKEALEIAKALDKVEGLLIRQKA